MISITSLIIKSAQPFEKIHIFYKILGLLQWDGSPFVKGKYFCGGGFRPRPKLPRPWAGPVDGYINIKKLKFLQINSREIFKIYQILVKLIH